MNLNLRRTTFLAPIALICALSLHAPKAAAQTETHYLLAQNLVAQTDPDEAFDPFSDYSEFDEASDEEADINFFRNGRFFTVGLLGGMRGFTGNFMKEYGSNATYGVALTYFFDLRTAFGLSFMTGDHSVGFGVNNGAKTYTGTVSLTSINLDFKYYFNTQNITRGLADLNPYGILGFGQFYRTYSLDSVDSLSRDSTMGVDVGVGLEIPMMRKRGFLGIQGCYHMVNFSDEGKAYVNGTEHLDLPLSGDFYTVVGILGMNF